MIEKEKVIKRIQAQIKNCKAIDSDWISLTVGTGKRILELLKEQEAIPLQYSETREEYWHYESICPKCGNRWISMGEDHFCPCCGQAVKEGDPDA